MKPTLEVVSSRINAAMGWAKPDTVIRNVQVPSVITGETEVTDIAILGNTIVSVYEPYDDAMLEGVNVIDGTGKFALPGFINAHAHIESSVLTPYEYERVALPFGETTLMGDPHEAANVLGNKAFEFFLKSASGMIMDMYVQLSSCVPATNLETSGANLTATDLAQFIDHPKAGGLAEMMNLGGVLGSDPEVIEKLLLFWDHAKPIDGHMPGIRGRALSALAVANIRNDHESTTEAEGREKLKKGVQVLIREGTVCKNLHALFNLINTQNAPNLCFCTDDMKPHDIIAQKGTMAHMIRTSIAQGRDPMAVYRIATLSAATHFGLTDRGVIAPGRKADIVLLNNLETCDVATVLKNGVVVTPEIFKARPALDAVGYQSVNVKTMEAADFAIEESGPDMDVIGVIPGSIVTAPLTRVTAGDDVIKLAVIERHGRAGGSMGLGLVSGFGITNGAIASTVAHDHHNVMVAGATDADMAVAVNRLKDMGGGFVVVRDGKVLADLALPVAGLMSDKPYESVVKNLDALALGLKQVCPLDSAFMYLSFLGLCVIPTLKLTDKGLTLFEPEKGDTGPRLIRDPRGLKLTP